MEDLTIHEVPDDAYEAIAARARRRGQSVAAAVLDLIQIAASEERLVQELERASRAAEIVHVTAPASGDAAPRAHRRYRRVEPTARRL